MAQENRAAKLPPIIQGGMGVAVSDWGLAKAVAIAGQIGVVSGVALETVHARRLSDGDPGGHLRRAYAAFPVPEIAERVVDRWFIEGGREQDEPYRPVPMFRTKPTRVLDEFIVLANFAEVWLAKEGHSGVVGINYLEKVQVPLAHSALGAVIAGVDVVIVGAGIPAQLPRMLDNLAAGKPYDYRVDVEGTATMAVHVDPATILGSPAPELPRPAFLAIVGSHTLATYLAKDPVTRPDGFVVEGPTAGGHNAPPRGRMQLDALGQPVYGERDAVDLDKLTEIGLPYWLAGGYGHPDAVRRALDLGAAGVQVGTAFALSKDSGIVDDLREAVVSRAMHDDLTVITDPIASPSGYPFKVASMPGTMSELKVYEDRERVCDLGFLRSGYTRPDGSVGMRCPAEPVKDYLRHGGDIADTVGRKCLCNGLLATVGLGQVRHGEVEPGLVTMGDDAAAAVAALGPDGTPWSAADVVSYLLGES